MGRGIYRKGLDFVVLLGRILLELRGHRRKAGRLDQEGLVNDRKGLCVSVN